VSGEAGIPGELKKALATRPAAAAAFEKLSPSHKAEYVKWILEGKTPEVRTKRAGQAVAKLSGV
jgi:uncharacterized protein YdeI (YjbR/CyaY-like superfamily)